MHSKALPEDYCADVFGSAWEGDAGGEQRERRERWLAKARNRTSSYVELVSRCANFHFRLTWSKNRCLRRSDLRLGN